MSGSGTGPADDDASGDAVEATPPRWDDPALRELERGARWRWRLLGLLLVVGVAGLLLAFSADPATSRKVLLAVGVLTVVVIGGVGSYRSLRRTAEVRRLDRAEAAEAARRPPPPAPPAS